MQAAFNFLQSYLLAYIGEHIVFDLRSAIYRLRPYKPTDPLP